MTDANRDVVVLGASAGGLEALQTLLAALPADLPAAVVVVLHLSPVGDSALPAILRRCSRMTASAVEDGEALVRGHIHVARPDLHVLAHDGVLRLSRGPRENGHRPSIDVMLRSAAHWLGARVIGVVLSGTLDDGTAGLVAVSRAGGLAIVQDPADAQHAGMPRSALEHVPDALVADAAGIAKLLADLVGAPVPSPPRHGEGSVPRRASGDVVAPGAAAPADARDGRRPAARAAADRAAEVAMAEFTRHALEAPDRPGQPVSLSCPDCNGSLFEIREEGFLRYRCRVGHAWSGDGLLNEQSQELEGVLWTALRSLEDKAALCRRLRGPAMERGNDSLASRYQDEEQQTVGAAKVLRRLLMDGRPDTDAAGELSP